jgi:hypothetical protein
MHFPRHLLGAMGLVGLGTSACLTAPVDGQEVSRRSNLENPLQLSMLLPAEWVSPTLSFRTYDDNGAFKGGECCTALTTTPFATDDIGSPWVRANPLIRPFTQSWIPNRDASHPNAKWKLRLEVSISRQLSPGVWGDVRQLFTFAGNANGTFTPATTSCLQAFRSSGGVSMGASCSQGFIADIYAIND